MAGHFGVREDAATTENETSKWGKQCFNQVEKLAQPFKGLQNTCK